MPYLDDSLVIGTETLQKGTWVPERNWERWLERAKHVPPHELIWRRDMPITSPSPRLSDDALRVLAVDMGTAQRDGLVYHNLIERLKNSPDETTADAVVDDMMLLGFRSASWDENAGGPPPHESPRPVERVLNWLFELSGKVMKFMLNGVKLIMKSLQNVSAVAVNVSVPLSVSI